MVSYLAVPPQTLIKAVAEELKKNNNIKPPVWTPFVKTGASKVRPPVEGDWWYTRVAAVLRTVAKDGPIGTNTLTVKYGGKQRRGHKKPHFKTGSGSIARKSLQQLQAAGFVKHETIGNHKGRVVTATGQQLLDKVAGAIAKVQ
ncbi:MAG TPA: 30S ribosomal protein S19e [Acidobacteriota bacterium]|nr:30S ribosomal protein S19e [Acidobacteriota bacterium]